VTEEIISLAHGNGGELTHKLIDEVFAAAFADPVLDRRGDAAGVELAHKKALFTTDSFVIRPLFFPGGDIGKLAVAGTVNDLCVAGAVPQFLSAAFIIEEGLPVRELEKIVASMRETAAGAGVRIVAGDTKVVERGSADKLFITTTGVGSPLYPEIDLWPGSIRPGDCVLLNGTIGDHAVAVLAARGEYPLSLHIKSDCACLNDLCARLLRAVPPGGIRVMRDPTRGGLATTLNEFVQGCGFGMEIDETQVPLKQEVQAVCELTGFDPLYLANEGKLALVCAEAHADTLLAVMRSHELGREARRIGRVTDAALPRLVLRTAVGGSRIVDMLAGDMLPRIC
jgi:hydrogenase expression/formation protein HypE